MTGLKELYEDALDWLRFEQASDDIHWYAWRVVKAFQNEAQRIGKPDELTLSSSSISDSVAKSLSSVKEG